MSGNAPSSQAEGTFSLIMHTLSTTLFTFFLVAIGCGIYHFFIVLPLFKSTEANAKIYYVADLEALSEAKVVAMLRARDTTGQEQSEAQVVKEMEQFRDTLRGDLLEMSNGFPIFQHGTVINAKTDIVDLTPILAKQLGLVLGDSLDTYLQGNSKEFQK